MKQFISLGILLAVLTSCGTETVVLEDAVEVPTAVVEQTISDIDTELANLDESDLIDELEKNIDTLSEEDLEITVEEDTIVIDDGDSTVTISEDWATVTGEATITSDLREVVEEKVAEVIPAASSAKVTKVQAAYNNSKQDVLLDIEYSLDDDGKISTIEIANTNGYNLWKNLPDGSLDVLIGKSIDEVDDTYVSGGTWTVPAIKSALTGE